MRLIGEERALEVRERRPAHVAVARRQFLDPVAGETLEIFCGAPQRRERRPGGLVRERDAHLRAGGERLEQRPLRARQVLEAVGEDGLTMPRLELGLQPLCGVAAQQVAIPEAEPLELRAVGAVQRRELALQLVRVEQSRLELAERPQQLVGEAAEARRGGEAVERRPREHAPYE